MSEEINKVEESVEVDGIFTRAFWLKRVGKVSFWAAIIVAIFTPIMAAAGMDWSQVTTWAGAWSIISGAVNSPATCVAILISLWSAINNPTSSGLGDVK